MFPFGIGGVDAGEAESGSIDITPRCRIGPLDQKLASEVKSMPAADHGDYVRWIEDVFLIVCAGAGCEPVCPSNCDRREDVGV